MATGIVGDEAGNKLTPTYTGVLHMMFLIPVYTEVRAALSNTAAPGFEPNTLQSGSVTSTA